MNWAVGLEVAGDRNTLIQVQRALPRAGSFVAFLTAGGIIAVATIIKFPLDTLAGEPLPPFITFYPAVVLAALCGGLRVAFTAATATLLLAWYLWLPHVFSFELSDARTSLTLIIYAVSSALLAWSVGLARLTLDEVAANQAERSLSARESVHRIKNLVAVVQALNAKIAREVTTTEEFRDLLSKRLDALAAAQNALIREDWNDVELSELIKGALAPFLHNPGLHLQPGPDIVVPARFVNGLCLALYELCTNAMKYGPLAIGEGPVTLSWRRENGKSVLEWREARKNGGAIETSGFGTMLIKTALARDPNTRVEYEFTQNEVIAIFRWPSAPSS
jgi:two-component sensor histidine kinase